MSEPSRRDPRVIALVVLLVVAVVLGAGLAFFGVGAELSQERTVEIVVHVVALEPEVADQIVAGETAYVDAGGMPVGTIVDVQTGPMERAVPDAQGRLLYGEDPTLDEATITIEATGREGNGIVAIDNQVAQAGMSFNVVTKALFLRGTLLTVKVR